MSVTNYQYKFSLPISRISLNSAVTEDENKFELWMGTGNNQSDVYILEVDKQIIAILFVCFFLIHRREMLNAKKTSFMSFKNWSKVSMTVLPVVSTLDTGTRLSYSPRLLQWQVPLQGT